MCLSPSAETRVPNKKFREIEIGIGDMAKLQLFADIKCSYSPDQEPPLALKSGIIH